MPWEILLSAFGMGLLGGAHCMGMCGGIAAALSFASSQKHPLVRFLILLSYNVGRILSYILLGAIFALASTKASFFEIPIARTIAGLLLVAMGFYLANWWRGLNYLEKAGAFVWKYIKPVGEKLLPVTNPLSALMLGMLWGWLPCGLVYTALALAATQACVHEGAMVMAAFGLGTLPALLFAGLGFDLIRAFLNKTPVRTVLAILYICFGLWTILAAWGIVPHHHGAHQHAPQHCEIETK